MKKIKKMDKCQVGFFSAGIFLLTALVLSSCSRKMNFQVSTVVPAAEGSIRIKKDRNKNYQIDLSTVNLAEPKRLDPPKSIYIVWMNTDQNGTKKVGQLKTASSMLSKTLKSSLKTSVPYNPTGFFISAEDDPDVVSPSGLVVLSTR